METFTIIDDGTNRPAWLEARRGGVTATDIARLARGGAGTWAAVRAEKEGRGRDFRNASMQHGIDREPIIAEYARSKFGLVPSTALVAALDNPHYLATPDAIGDEEVGEIKTTVHDWTVLSDAPGRYVDQGLWQMRVTRRRRCRLIFEPHENGVPLYPFPKDFVIEWDELRIAELEVIAQQFLQGGESDALAPELDAMLTARVEAKDIADVAAARVTDIDDQIKEFMAANKRTKFEGSLANLTLSAAGTSNRFDSTAFKAAQPDVYQKFVKVSTTSPRLTITVRSDS